MKRVQLFEFEDQKWFNSTLRTGLTKILAVLHKVTKLHEVLANEIDQFLDETGENELFDFGSGAGGAMPQVLSNLKEKKQALRLTLSDLYPDKRYIDLYAEREDIRYEERSVDATQRDKKLNGLKTLINSFHHLRPEKAKQVLLTAQSNGDSILIYEMAENNIPLLLWWLFLPLGLTIVFISALLMTPFVEGLTAKQLLLTYVIPVIPIAYAWDGQASLPRIYSKGDIEIMLSEIGSVENYEWKIKPALNQKGKKQGYVILGKSTLLS